MTSSNDSADEHCLADGFLKFFSQEWMSHIVFSLARHGPLRFGALRRQLPPRSFGAGSLRPAEGSRGRRLCRAPRSQRTGVACRVLSHGFGARRRRRARGERAAAVRRCAPGAAL